MQHMMRYQSLEEIESYPEDQAIGMCEYFEDGCLCIHSGKLVIMFDYSPQKLYHHYLTGCTCSRHPDGELKLTQHKSE